MFDVTPIPAGPLASQSPEEKEAVGRQLERVLCHPLFQHSRRVPAMLRYIVEKALEGSATRLKERIIGIEIFGREPAYNTNDDPVVRMVAREIRRRLAQYYSESDHFGELRIDLPTGSYVPTFSLAGNPVHNPGSSSVTSSGETKFRRKLLPAGLAVVSLLVATAGGVLAIFRLHPSPRSGDLDSFWAPFVQGKGLITICMGDPEAAKVPDTDSDLLEPSNATPKPDPQSASWSQLRSGNVALGDVAALSKVLRQDSFHDRSYWLAMAPNVSFAQLQEGPILLIGAYDNRWTMRLTEKLRFHFITSKNDVGMIADRRNPAQTSWSISNGSYQHFSRDFAIVARFHDATTNQPVVAIGGFSEQGTEAAGEILSDSASFSNLLKNAPSNWRSMNMEAVIATDIITGQPGPPQVLAVEFWRD